MLTYGRALIYFIYSRSGSFFARDYATGFSDYVLLDGCNTEKTAEWNSHTKLTFLSPLHTAPIKAFFHWKAEFPVTSQQTFPIPKPPSDWARHFLWLRQFRSRMHVPSFRTRIQDKSPPNSTLVGPASGNGRGREEGAPDRKLSRASWTLSRRRVTRDTQALHVTSSVLSLFLHTYTHISEDLLV